MQLRNSSKGQKSTRAQLFKTNDGVSYHVVKTLINIYVIDKPWLLSRFWVYCKLYHSLVTFQCLTTNEAEPSLGQTVKGHQIML